jgi:Bacterial Ig-like domain (group 3)/MBG domain (YGX type)
VLTGAPSLTTTANGTSPVGGYTITAAQGSLAATNYSFGFVNGTLTVTQALTTTTVTSSSNPAGPGNVIFTATVVPNPPGAGVAATGTVNFYDGAALLGPGVLSSGQATYNTSSLTSGNHDITAVYDGDSNYVGSTSPIYTQVIN